MRWLSVPMLCVILASTLSCAPRVGTFKPSPLTLHYNPLLGQCKSPGGENVVCIAVDLRDWSACITGWKEMCSVLGNSKDYCQIPP